MNILFLTRKAWPNIGGVEKHILEVSKRLKLKGESVQIISEDNINYSHIKYLGLFQIWFWLFKNRKIIEKADIVHVHDVFIWYLPFRFLFKNKKVFTTFHGWEEIYPIPFVNKLQKKIAWKLSNGSVAIGKYIEKYYHIKVDRVIYGGVSMISNRLWRRITESKVKNSYLYVGRLEENTGLGEFLRFLDTQKKYKIDFVGDGRMRKECEKYGKVHGFTNPTKFYKKAETVIPSGYLTYLEAKSYGAKIKTFYSTELKKEYWSEILKLKKFQSWDEITNEYYKLWKI